MEEPRAVVLAQHLKLLRFLLSAGSECLSESMAVLLWSIIDDPVDAEDVTTMFAWFKDIIEVFTDDRTKQSLLQHKLEAYDPLKMSMESFDCFKLLFIFVNRASGRIDFRKLSDIHLNRLDLVGGDYLWDAALTCPVAAVSSSARTLLHNVYGEVPRTLLQTNDTTHWRLYLVEMCMQRLGAANVAPSLLSHGHVSATTPMATPIKTTPHSVSSAASPSPDTVGASCDAMLPDVQLACRKATRCLRLIQTHVAQQRQIQHLGLHRQFFSHEQSGWGVSLTLSVSAFVLYTQHATPLTLRAHSHQPLVEIRDAIAVQMHWEHRSRIELSVNGVNMFRQGMWDRCAHADAFRSVGV